MNERPPGTDPDFDLLPFETDDRAARVLVQLLHSHFRSGNAWDKLPHHLPLISEEPKTPMARLLSFFRRQDASNDAREEAATTGLRSKTPLTLVASTTALPPRPRPRTRRSMVLLGIPLAAVLIAGVALAASTIFNLGKPTSNVPQSPYYPLAAFHRAGPFLRQHGKPELLFLGTMIRAQLRHGALAAGQGAHPVRHVFPP